MALVNNIFQLDMVGLQIDEKLGDMIKLYPLANVVYMAENAGQNVLIPITEYIQAAEVVGAGEAITATPFVQKQESATVKKIAKLVTFNQEDINNAYMDVQQIAETQLVKSLADGIEKDMFTQLDSATLTKTITSLNTDGLADAIVPFGEDIEDPMYLFVNPADLAEMRHDPEFVVNASHGMGIVGSAGMIFGMEVIVTNRVTAKTAYIVKQGALALFIKKGAELEQSKDIVHQKYNLVATQHYVTKLVDPAKAIKVTVNAG